jgi:hypothetical protein
MGNICNSWDFLWLPPSVDHRPAEPEMRQNLMLNDNFFGRSWSLTAGYSASMQIA